MQSFDSNTYS